MSNEYTFFTDQTALTFRICLVLQLIELGNECDILATLLKFLYQY